MSRPQDVRAVALEVSGERLQLLPERAVFWPAKETLLIADPHWGKAAAFRTHGIPIPDPTANDLARLSRCLERTEAKRLVVLGDLLHARRGRSDRLLTDSVGRWRDRHPALEVLLVNGNHDRYAGRPDADWRIETVDEPFEQVPFILRHIPEPDERGYVLSGHLHPAVKLFDSGESLKLPCFLFGEQVAVLPAFSEFIDGWPLSEVKAGDRLYLIAEEEVLPYRC